MNLHAEGNFADFGVDTISFGGSLEAKLAAVRAAGFVQVMLGARDLAEHPAGFDAAVQLVRGSGLQVTGLRMLQDYEGLDGALHEHKIGVAKSLLETCALVGAKRLLVGSTTSPHAHSDVDAMARDLRKLAMLAVPLRVCVAYEALPEGRHVNGFAGAFQPVWRADMPNLGLSLGSSQTLPTDAELEELEYVDPDKIVLVRLAEFMWPQTAAPGEVAGGARRARVFPGEGMHRKPLADWLLRIHRLGYRGDYSLDACNDDYLQMPLSAVADRARASARWLGETVLQRSVPLPNAIKLRRSG